MTEEAAAEEVQNLIPGLPDEIAMECLIRVPYQFHSDMKSVCHGWQNLISSPSFYQERLQSGTAEHLVCQIQPLPSPSQSQSQSQSPPPTPTTRNDSTQMIPDHPRTNSAKKDEEDQQQPQQQQIHSPPQYGLTIYNATNQSWQRIRPKFAGIPMFCHCLALQSSGKLLLLGGWDPATLEPVPDVYVLDMIKGGSWRRAAPMSVARSFFACGVVGGSKVYVAGGHDSQKNALKSAELYDVEADEWRMLAEMEEERDECQGLCWEGDDRFWVVSGYGTENQGRFRSDVECYDPATGNWSKFDGLWPFANISPRGSTITVTSRTCATGIQFQWLWFFSKEQQKLLHQQQNGEATAIAREYEDKEKRWKIVSSVVQLPNSITGLSPCVSVTPLGHDLQRVFVMTGNGGRGRSPSSCLSPSSSCNECEGEGAFMMERDNRSGNTKWKHVHVHMPPGFSGFPYSASSLII